MYVSIDESLFRYICCHNRAIGIAVGPVIPARLIHIGCGRFGNYIIERQLNPNRKTIMNITNV